jgi:hypothetical protein
MPSVSGPVYGGELALRIYLHLMIRHLARLSKVLALGQQARLDVLWPAADR